MQPCVANDLPASAKMAPTLPQRQIRFHSSSFTHPMAFVLEKEPTPPVGQFQSFCGHPAVRFQLLVISLKAKRTLPEPERNIIPSSPGCFGAASCRDPTLAALTG